MLIIFKILAAQVDYSDLMKERGIIIAFKVDVLCIFKIDLK